MDKHSENKAWRRSTRLRIGRFIGKNGVYIALGLCFAVICGVTAAIIAGGGESPAEHSYDQRLDEVRHITSLPAVTPAPTAKDSSAPRAKTPVPELTPSVTQIPSFTPAPSASAEPAPAKLELIAPADGSVIRVFAMDCLIFSKTLNQWMTHPGVDIAAPKGSEVRAVLAGTVERVYADDMLGVTVVIAHENGLRTCYSNLKEDPPVSEGMQVESRAVIGYIGATAISECAEQAHLHFELYVNGIPVDPAKYVLFPSMQ